MVEEVLQTVLRWHHYKVSKVVEELVPMGAMGCTQKLEMLS